MATYTIRTTRQQEVGLKYAYDYYADKTVYLTQQDYFQYRIDMQVSNPLYVEQQKAMSQSFDDSFKTIPETEQPVAKVEIENVITAHGGSVVPPGPVNPGPAPVAFVAPAPLGPPPVPPAGEGVA